MKSIERKKVAREQTLHASRERHASERRDFSHATPPFRDLPGRLEKKEYVGLYVTADTSKSCYRRIPLPTWYESI